MSKFTKVTMAAACGSIMLTGAAQAETVLNLIGTEPGTNVLLSDEARQEFINNTGDSNVVDVGDVFRGVFQVEQLSVTTNGSPVESDLVQSAGNEELTGLFSIEVVSKSEDPDNPGVFDFVFGPDSSFDTDSNGTLFRLWADGSQTTFSGNFDDSKSEARDVVSDGDFFFGVGLAEAGNNMIGRGTDLIDAIESVPPSDRLAFSSFALNRTESGIGSSLLLAILSNSAGSGEFIGSSNIGGAVAGSDWEQSANINAEFQIVPTPAAAGLGLVLLGLFGTARRRKA